jgi:hypothetical protein
VILALRVIHRQRQSSQDANFPAKSKTDQSGEAPSAVEFQSRLHKQSKLNVLKFPNFQGTSCPVEMMGEWSVPLVVDIFTHQTS